ncbi:hypothetical protein H0H93_002834 [Arthromyces matolae]|nr:hypothetical protein H0H93_002834 [Arthromyces matolae]
MSEIEDIFASKGKNTPAQPLASTSSAIQKEDKHKNKKNKKRKRVEPTIAVQEEKHIPTPETVVDTSNDLSKPKRPKLENKPRISKPSTNKEPATDEAFTDSRGSRPKRTTEEGWTIYKEDELGIREDGGGKLDIHPVFSPFTFWTQTPPCVHLTAIVVFEPIYTIYAYNFFARNCRS